MADELAPHYNKAAALLASALSLWLASHAPLGKMQGVLAFCALACSCQLIPESKRLIILEARAIAFRAMQQELQAVEFTCATMQGERELQQQYGQGTYEPEILEEIQKSLEFLYSQVSAVSGAETSTSEELKKYPPEVVRAVKLLKERNVSDTDIIQLVLKLGGDNWARGKQVLQQILQQE